MTVTAHTGVGEPVIGTTCGSAPDVRLADNGVRGVSFADTGCPGTVVSFPDVGGDATHRPVTVREGLPALDRPVQLRAQHVPAATEPVGPPVDATGLVAVQEAGLLQLGDQ